MDLRSVLVVSLGFSAVSGRFGGTGQRANGRAPPDNTLGKHGRACTVRRLKIRAYPAGVPGNRSHLGSGYTRAPDWWTRVYLGPGSSAELSRS